MGLEDIASDVEEEVNSLSDDDIKEFTERVAVLQKTVVNLDKKVEELETKMEAYEMLISTAIQKLDEQPSESGFLEDEEDEEDSSPKWQ